MPNTDRYEYQDLPPDNKHDKYVRILTLRPSQDHDGISADLEVHLLRTAPTYESLSYTWGDSTPTEAIQISDYVFGVTSNLKTALECLRYTRRVRRLWIDAICINQDDLEERSRQVAIMREIYQNARQVIVWLGPAEHDSDEMLGLISKVVERGGNDWLKMASGVDIQALYRNSLSQAAARQKSATRDQTAYDHPPEQTIDQNTDANANAQHGHSAAEHGDHVDQSSPAFSDSESNSDNDDSGMQAHPLDIRLISLLGKSKTSAPYQMAGEDLTDDQLISLRKLYSRPWFERVWIVQEVAVARECIIQCGRSKLDWIVFCTGTSLITNLQQTVRIGQNGVRFTLDLHGLQSSFRSSADSEKTVKTLDPLYILRRYSTHLATDPRDKVYALIGMASNGFENQRFTIDYTQPTEEAYQEFAIRHMEMSRKLHVISVARGSDSFCDLPTWVPDWSDTSDQPWTLVGVALREENGPIGRKVRQYLTTADSFAAPRIEDRNRLCLKGYTIDVIETVGEAMTAIDDITKAFAGMDFSQGISLEQVRRILDSFRFSHVIAGWDKIAGVCDPHDLRGDPCHARDDMNLQSYTRTLLGDVDTEKFLRDCHMYRLAAYECSEILQDRASVDIKPSDTSLAEDLTKKGLNLLMQMVEAQNRCHLVQETATAVGYIFGRRFFRSVDGRYGLAGKNTRSGDKIVLLKGGDAPMVVRPHPTDSIAFEFIGEAYLDGVMYGELWDEGRCEEIALL